GLRLSWEKRRTLVRPALATAPARPGRLLHRLHDAVPPDGEQGRLVAVPPQGAAGRWRRPGGSAPTAEIRSRPELLERIRLPGVSPPPGRCDRPRRDSRPEGDLAPCLTQPRRCRWPQSRSTSRSG